MENAGRLVPWGGEIALVVCVVNKHLAVFVEIEVQRVAQAAGNQPPVISVRIGRENVTVRRLHEIGAAMLAPFFGEELVRREIPER